MSVQQIAMPWTKDEPRSVLLQLPWPPSMNHYWRRSPHGGMYVSTEGKNYCATVSAQIRRLHEDRLLGRVGLDVKFFPPNRLRRDLDNCLKVMIDAIAASEILANDFQIKKLCAEMMEVQPGGHAIVELTEMPEPFTLF